MCVCISDDDVGQKKKIKKNFQRRWRRRSRALRHAHAHALVSAARAGAFLRPTTDDDARVNSERRCGSGAAAAAAAAAVGTRRVQRRRRRRRGMERRIYKKKKPVPTAFPDDFVRYRSNRARAKHTIITHNNIPPKVLTSRSIRPRTTGVARLRVVVNLRFPSLSPASMSFPPARLRRDRGRYPFAVFVRVWWRRWYRAISPTN